MSKETFDLGTLLRKTQEDLQGYVLDEAKISPMTDRQYEQFAKNVKKYFRSQIDVINDTIKAIMAEGLMEIVVSDRPPYSKDQTTVKKETVINDEKYER